MKLPEVVVFDLGKVLLDFDYCKAAQSISTRGTMSPEAIQRFINQSPLLHRYETGLMTSEEFFAEVRRETGFKDDLAEFGPIFGNIFEPIDAMLELHASLRKRGIPTFIFSNTNEMAIAHIRRTYPFFAGFDDYILSYEHRAMKPQAKLYEVVESKTQRQRGQILYIDDRPENIEAGAARGWEVILQETPEKTLAAVKRIGLLGHHS